MRTYIWKGLIGVAFTGGLLALGAGVAHADTITSGDDGTGSGSQAVIGLTLPITIGGNGISILGDSSSSGSTTSAPVTAPVTAPVSDATTSGDLSLLGGTQALVDANAPVTVDGNAVSVLGDSSSSGSGSQSAGPEGATGVEQGSGPNTSGTESTLGGSQVVGDVNAPVAVGGNAISVVGDSSSSGATTSNGSSGTGGAADPASAPTTSGFDSTLGGTQVAPDATAPVTASGNALSVVGDSSSNGSTTGSSGVGGTDTGDGAGTSGDDGTASGSQIAPVINAPITVEGNGISVIGDSSTTSGDPGQTGEVGGVEVFAPEDPGTLATAAVSERALLATTGVPAMPALAIGLLLLMLGLGVVLRGATLRRRVR
jgi:hypothetical protein